KAVLSTTQPLPDYLKPHLDRTGWVPSATTRARMSAAQEARGRVRRDGCGPPWTDGEDTAPARNRSMTKSVFSGSSRATSAATAIQNRHRGASRREASHAKPHRSTPWLTWEKLYGSSRCWE